jgi:hypothetical protein
MYQVYLFNSGGSTYSIYLSSLSIFLQHAIHYPTVFCTILLCPKFISIKQHQLPAVRQHLHL